MVWRCSDRKENGERRNLHFWQVKSMRLFRSWRHARSTSRLAMGILLCTGAFLCLLPTELEVSAAHTTVRSHHLDQGANEGNLAAVAPEEADDADGRPVNADVLSALLAEICFGAMVGWLLANGRGQRVLRGSRSPPSVVRQRP
jgi:hypothetical protein